MLEDNLIERLRKVNKDDVPLFSLNGVVTHAKLVDNYDGDTGDIVLIYNDKLMRLKARFQGYDSCEIKPLLNDPNKEAKKTLALKAKTRLWELCGGGDSLIKIVCGPFDKYGRLLITAFPENSSLTNIDKFEDSINAQMIAEGHGRKYDGGTR